ncbi:pyridoxamine 5'-phosphate oxidase family protein [soil metagenome]
MARTYETIDAGLAEFLESQPVFFVATAPLAGDGHVNVSPKGHDTLRVLDPTTVAYLDLTGSGVETVAHLRENGRITIMVCAFQGKPRIVRLHGRGTAVVPGDEGFDDLVGRFPKLAGTRSVIVVAVERVSSSCGYAVPLMTPAKERTQLKAWAERKGPDALVEYRAEKNATSIDGLPGLPGF